MLFVKKEDLHTQDKKVKSFAYLMLLLIKVLIPQLSCWNHCIVRNELGIFEPYGVKTWIVDLVFMLKVWLNVEIINSTDIETKKTTIVVMANVRPVSYTHLTLPTKRIV